MKRKRLVKTGRHPVTSVCNAFGSGGGAILGSGEDLIPSMNYDSFGFRTKRPSFNGEQHAEFNNAEDFLKAPEIIFE